MQTKNIIEISEDHIFTYAISTAVGCIIAGSIFKYLGRKIQILNFIQLFAISTKKVLQTLF